MLVFGTIVFLLFFILYVISRNFNREYFMQLDKKEEPLRILYPLVGYVTGLFSSIIKDRVHNERKKVFEELYIGRAVEMQKLHYYRKVSLMILVCFSSFLIGTLVELTSNTIEIGVIDNKVVRPSVGQGRNSVNLEYNAGNGLEGKIDLAIGEKKLKEKEVEALFEEAIGLIDKEILLNNKSIDEVTSNMNFMTSIPKSSIIVEWKVSDDTYINTQGVIRNEELIGAKACVDIEATLTYYEYQKVYKRQIYILPKFYTKEEILQKSLNEELIKIDDETKHEDTLPLPDKVGGYNLIWEVSKEKKGSQLVLLGLVGSFFIMLGTEEALKSKKKLRDLQMLIDYPEIICKFTLLLNAGMTIRGAFERIVVDYQKKQRREEATSRRKKVEPRYAYEELVIAIRELELSRPETMVYESFGQRCALLCYLRFSTIIVQNMKKGTKGIVQMLETESSDAFAERKECAKRLGEEAGTKLLGPMMGMLAIVLIIILVPAFMSFNF